MAGSGNIRTSAIAYFLGICFKHLSGFFEIIRFYEKLVKTGGWDLCDLALANPARPGREQRYPNADAP